MEMTPNSHRSYFYAFDMELYMHIYKLCVQLCTYIYMYIYIYIYSGTTYIRTLHRCIP